MKPARELYPEKADEGSSFYGPGDYTPIIEALGNVVARGDDHDYQGDTFALVESNERYGFVRIGWGSCSGCDALQACSSFADIDKLAAEIESGVTWFDGAPEAKAWFEAHDWQGEHSWHAEGLGEFLRAAWPLLGCAGSPPEVQP